LTTISWPTVPGQTAVLIARVYSINSLDSKFFDQLFILQASLFSRKAMTSKSFSFLNMTSLASKSFGQSIVLQAGFY
jgi:hypothetical protein